MLFRSEDIPKLGARMAFEGHDANVRDVQFCPSRYLIKKNHLLGALVKTRDKYELFHFLFLYGGLVHRSFVVSVTILASFSGMFALEMLLLLKSLSLSLSLSFALKMPLQDTILALLSTMILCLRALLAKNKYDDFSFVFNDGHY